MSKAAGGERPKKKTKVTNLYSKEDVLKHKFLTNIYVDDATRKTLKKWETKCPKLIGKIINLQKKGIADFVSGKGDVRPEPHGHIRIGMAGSNYRVYGKFIPGSDNEVLISMLAQIKPSDSLNRNDKNKLKAWEKIINDGDYELIEWSEKDKKEGK